MANATDEEERAHLVHNERIKIRATLFNTMAAGVVSPLAVGTVSGTGVNWLTLLFMTVALLVAATRHYGARAATDHVAIGCGSKSLFCRALLRRTGVHFGEERSNLVLERLR